jgi:hypothetical protein
MAGVMAAVCVAAAVCLAAAEGKTYGKGVTLTTATPVATLLAAPKDYVGKTVRVDGIVTAVCDKAGCWMDLRDEKADPTTAKTLRMKVNDGEISFPLSAKGKKASIEGVFEPVGEAMAKEYAADAKEAKAGSEMKTPAPAYQLKGSGAVIY